MKLIPSKKQFKDWTLLSKVTYIAFVLTVLSLLFVVIISCIKQITGATKKMQIEAHKDRNAKHKKEMIAINSIKKTMEQEKVLNKLIYFEVSDLRNIEGLYYFTI